MSTNITRSTCLPGLLIAALAVFTVTACSTTGEVNKETALNIERVDSEGARISTAYLTRMNGHLLLRGEVTRRAVGRGAIPGHLHITLIDPHGKTLKQADIGYVRRSARSSSATFSTQLPLPLAPGSTVRITHFYTETHEVPAHAPAWREGE